MRGNGSDHVQGDDEYSCRAHLVDGVGDRAPHQRTGQHQCTDARQPCDGSDRTRQRILTHHRNRVHADLFPANVVAVSFPDRPDGHLADLRPGAHDDDALSIHIEHAR